MNLKNQVLERVEGRLYGLDTVVEQCLVAIIAGGHVVLEGVPGLGKTALIHCLAQVFDVQFKRVQFTPDLMPADITGSEILDWDPDTQNKGFRFVSGPLFTNFLLADEINRTPPRTQSALLEAMQEKSVTVGQTTHKLPRPFSVFATMNPIEQEGTYVLPEAELDRFLMKVEMEYPSEEDERKIANAMGQDPSSGIESLCGADDILEYQEKAQKIEIPASLTDYAVRLVRNSRPGNSEFPEVNTWVRIGAGPRASQALVKCAAARAFLYERQVVLAEDIDFVALPVLRHRIQLRYEALENNLTADSIVEKILHHTAQ